MTAKRPTIAPERMARLLAVASSRAGAIAPVLRALWPSKDGHDDHGRGGLDKLEDRHGETIPTSALGKASTEDAPEVTAVYDAAIAQGQRPRDVRLDPRAVVAVQGEVEAGVVRKYLDRGEAARKGPIQVVSLGGRLFAADGHHRLAAALLRKDRAIQAEVYVADGLEALGAAPEFRALWPDKTGHDDHGRGEPAGEGASQGEGPKAPQGWPKGLQNVSGAKGSNPGGLYKDETGQKWYVKRYNDPRQAASEQISNEVYRAVGLGAPESVLGEGGDYASKWQEVDGTLGKLGVTPERADAVLDGFAADVFLMNWDAVGTGHDNVVFKGDKATRIDQGGTLLFRAQGALKPAVGLGKVDEWESLVKNNHYYAQVFKAAGVKGGDGLGERAAKQIDRIVAARPKGGWRAFADKAAPRAPESFRKAVGEMLEARQKGLEGIRDRLRGKRTLAEFRALWPDASGHDDHGRGSDPLAGEKRGEHTPEGQRKLIGYLEKATGAKFKGHGSVSKGATSKNDFDIAMAPPSAADLERMSNEANREQSDLMDKVARGEMTEHEAMSQLYGDAPDPVAEALAKIGFEPESSVEFDGSPDGRAGDPEVVVQRYSNKKTKHAVEIWMPLRALAALRDLNCGTGEGGFQPGNTCGVGGGGKFTDGDGSDSGVVVKQKAAAATKDQIAKAVEMKKAGASYAKIQQETGLNPKQAATIVFKANKKEKELAAALKSESTNPLGFSGPGKASAADVAKAEGYPVPPGGFVQYGNVYDKSGNLLGKAAPVDKIPPGGKVVGGTIYDKGGNAVGFVPAPKGETFPLGPSQGGWSSKTTMAANGDVTNAKGEKLEWKEKTTGAKENIGKYAYFKGGVQVSAPMAKGDHLKAAATINNGKGPDYAAPVYQAPPPEAPSGFAVTKGAGKAGEWPIGDNVSREMGTSTPKALNEKGYAWESKLTSGERSAVQSYTGSGYSSINSSLRKGGSLTGNAGKIASAIEKHDAPPPPDLVWRGVSNSGVGSVAASLGAGDVIELKGFQSTSIKPEFAHSWGSGKTIFEIKPAKGAYVKVISSHSSEYEYLLPHAAKYTVAGVKEVKFGATGGKHKVIQLEMHK